MSITVVFELEPVSEDRPFRVSPSNFAIDLAKGLQTYSFDYTVVSATGQIHSSSEVIRVAVGNTRTLPPSKTVTIPIDGYFRQVFPIYIQWLSTQQAELIGEKQLTQSLELADLLEDEAYINYVVQQIFDNWSTLMSVVVRHDFYAELQQLVFIRAPYFLLPFTWQKDKIFMAGWFKRNHNVTVLVDKRFLHFINDLHESSTHSLLYNGLKDKYDDRASVPVVTFYNDADHRLQRVSYTASITSEVTRQVSGPG